MSKWSFHPKPQSKPITVRQALIDCPTDSIKIPKAVNSVIYQKMAYVKPGSNLKKLLNKESSYFSHVRAHYDKPCPTICKTLSSGDISIFHPRENRNLSISELKRLASFPDDFRFLGNYEDALGRIGNCVPPLLMKAIADNLRQSPFLKDVENPTAIDTFSGCGGSSLGLKLAGFKELLAVELDNNAAATFRLNFPDVRLFHGDICKLTSQQVLAITGINKGSLDLFTGSPPCQGVSVAGKRDLNDPRNSLYKEYARLINELQPKSFVMENVKGMIKGFMKNIYLDCIKTLRDCGYICHGQVLNAMFYHVPQSRERVFIIGVRRDIFEQSREFIDCSNLKVIG